jgi:hypothetical protein
MTVQSYKMGPGSLTLDAGAEDVTAQVTNMRTEWSENVKSTDDIPTLDGGALEGEDTVSYDAKLVGNVVQDIAAAGLVDFTWANKGEEVTFVFIPNTVEARKVTGTCRIVPITVGGDVGQRNTADISWACTVDPALANVV